MSDRYTLRIATRASPLAVAQARLVGQALPAPWELVEMTTRGDRRRGPGGPGAGKGQFTRELESALRRGEVHLAVHSAKDVPVEMPEGLVVAAVPARADPRDALVAAADPAALPRGARVGTSSRRRAEQVRGLREDLEVLPLRGNVHTRLRRLREGRFDAVVLAMAGLERLGLLEDLGARVRAMDPEQFVPAAGQGALLVQCRADDAQTRALLERVNDPTSAEAVEAERAVVAALGADCRSAVGVHVRLAGGLWKAVGFVGGHGAALRETGCGPTARDAAEQLLRRLLEAGAASLLSPDR